MQAFLKGFLIKILYTFPVFPILATHLYDGVINSNVLKQHSLHCTDYIALSDTKRDNAVWVASRQGFEEE
jgi:hypothetical protein